MKKSITPRTLSAEDMYIDFCKSLLDDNSFYTPKTLSLEGKITRFTKIFYQSKKEIVSIDERLKKLTEELYILIDKQTDNINTISEIDDIKVNIQSLLIKRKELLLGANTKKEIISYKLFKDVLTLYNKKAGEAIIEGGKLNLLCNLGYLSGIRKERSFKTKTVNWGETNKLRDENGELPENEKTGKKKMVYFSDDEWCRVSWLRSTGIRNITVYGFTPSGGQSGKGFRQAFSQANLNNPNLKLRYEYLKLKNYNKDAI